MSLDYIRDYYRVPAKKGVRVNAYGKPGTITGTRYQYLLIRLDGAKRSRPYHPRDGIEYLDASQPKEASAKVIAYCWASGLIQFGEALPEGAIGIAEGEATKVRDVIEVTARLAYDNESLLVPGVPEAPNPRAAIAALARYIQWLGERNEPGFRALGCEMQQPNPFIPPGRSCGAVDTDSRLRALEGFDLHQCRAALEVPGLQKTVEKKLHSRIRLLERQAATSREA